MTPDVFSLLNSAEEHIRSARTSIHLYQDGKTTREAAFVDLRLALVAVVDALVRVTRDSR